MSARAAFALLLLATACGIKALPQPPLPMECSGPSASARRPAEPSSSFSSTAIDGGAATRFPDGGCFECPSGAR